MAYVITMPTVQQVKAELDADPLGLGYAALESAQNWNGLVALLNQVPRQVIDRRMVRIQELTEAIVYSEFATRSAGERDALLWIATTSDQALDPQNPNVRAFFAGTFSGPGGALTRANLIALQTRQGSRAEFLWGDGVIVNDSLVEAAARL